MQKRKKSLVHHMVLYACNYLSEEDLAFSGDCQSSITPRSVSSCTGTGGMFAFGHGGVVSSPRAVKCSVLRHYFILVRIANTHFASNHQKKNYLYIRMRIT